MNEATVAIINDLIDYIKKLAPMTNKVEHAAVDHIVDEMDKIRANLKQECSQIEQDDIAGKTIFCGELNDPNGYIGNLRRAMRKQADVLTEAHANVSMQCFLAQAEKNFKNWIKNCKLHYWFKL